MGSALTAYCDRSKCEFANSSSTIEVKEKPAIRVAGVSAFWKRFTTLLISSRRSCCSSLRRCASSSCLSAASIAAVG